MDITEKNIAEIIPAVNLPRDLTQFFSYQIPEKLKEEIKIGDAVTVPFRKKDITGVVHTFSSKVPTNLKIKDIKNITKEISLSEKQMELAKFISQYYYVPLSIVVKAMLPERTKKESRKEISFYNAYDISEPDTEIKNKILNTVYKEKQLILIHSLGADKHKIYQDILEEHMTSGQTLLMLPEYFDIWNFAQSYIDTFGRDNVAVLCSDITKNQYFKEWQKVKSGAAKLVIGTRQTVFAPFTDLRLILVDDEHSSSYKQWDQNPRYHGVDAAISLAQIHDAKILLSSSTPSLESYQRTRDTFIKIDISKKPEVPLQIVDFNTERRSGNYSFISEDMRKTLLEKIYAKKQALIFIPRLGEKTMHQCRDCGYIAQCDICQNAFISYKNKLYCSRCKELHEPIRSCPNCQGQNIGAFGGGSQRVLEEVKNLFENKNINIIGLDSSTASDSRKNQKILEDFQKGEIDILVGTQMVWKNWNMPNLKLVGIIFPEIIFGSPGFRSKEHAWQFLARAYGFAKSKDIIVETYKPEHKYFRESRNKSMEEYFPEELENRQTSISKIPYPPLGKLIKLIYKHTDPRACEKEAKWQHEILQRALFDMHLQGEMEIISPFPAHSYREYGKYRWHIIIKHSTDLCMETRDQLLEHIKKDWIIDIDPDEIL